MLKFNQIDHINITVNNLEKSVDFYSRVFGFKIYEDSTYNKTPYKIIGKSGAAMLCLYQNKKSPIDSEKQKSSINHIGFNIDFYDEIVKDLERMEVKINYINGSAIIEYPESKSIYISDPDGNEIELTEQIAGGL